MFSKKVIHITQLGAVGLVGYCIGANNETKDKIFKKLQALSGLPFLGPVSAALVYSPGLKSTHRVGEILKYGYPSFDQLLGYQDYVVAYDRKNKVPYWVLEHITKNHVQKNDVDRNNVDFRPDEDIHPFFRSQNSDYKGSGFDRGHMAAAGNHKLSKEHLEETFYLTNIAPQVGEGFNRHAWNRLEKHIRKLTKNFENIYCATGPLYLPRKEADGNKYVKYQVIGANSVAVPTHFFKIVLCEAKDGSLHMESYVMPNQKIPDDTPLTSFMVHPDTIQKAAGFLFFRDLHKSQLSTLNGKKQAV